jgi:hypothetical protein
VARGCGAVMGIPSGAGPHRKYRNEREQRAHKRGRRFDSMCA